jgi:hypothetical protein
LGDLSRDGTAVADPNGKNAAFLKRDYERMAVCVERMVELLG